MRECYKSDDFKNVFQGLPVVRKPGHFELSAEFVAFFEPLVKSPVRHGPNDGFSENHVVIALGLIV